MSEALSGLLVIDKPAGLTSFDCVNRIKRLLQVEKVGHCGTLDPMAKGILLILVGKATRYQDSYLGLEKQYWLRARFGEASETGDREGRVIATKPYDGFGETQLKEVLKGFVGTHLQTPPRYSALKYKGKPYYKWARMGVDIPRIPRAVEIRSIEFLNFAANIWEARVLCSRGTYVRTFVEDVALKLGTLGLLDDLIRERVGEFDLSQALPWEMVSESNRGELLQHFQCADRS